MDLNDNNITEINIEINDDEYYYDHEYTMLQACEKIGISIPRFCYHNKLKIAGNCRVCIVEEIKSNKPIISCATLINSGNEIYTQTEMALDGRESVIEYLLINHPLDCPICDQGGERDSQDQTIIYGSDMGRYYEFKKRSVENKNYTPLIKFFLNRCIHCARCTRFSHDISSSFLFSLLGRGNNTEISSYTKNLFLDELSGNVIDSCPVGASTSKPYAFISRVWELVDYKSLDIFDSLNSLIKLECRGLNIIRVLPLINDNINDEWISDKVRFNYDSYNKQRIINCMFIINNKFYYYSWINSLYFYKNYFYKKIFFFTKKKLKFSIVSNINYQFRDLYSAVYLRRFYSNLNIKYLNFDTFSNSFRKNFLPYNHLNMKNEEDVDKNINIVLINCNIRFESPVFNLRIKNLLNLCEDKLSITNLGINFSNSYLINNFGNNILSFIKKFNLINFSNKMTFNNNYVIFGTFLLHVFNQELNLNNYFKYVLSNLYKNIFNFIHLTINSTDIVLKEINLAENSFNKNLIMKSYLLNNFSSLFNNYILNKFSIKSFFGHHFFDSAKNYNLIMPIKFYNEKPLAYINLEGYINLLDVSLLDYKYSIIKKESDLLDIIGRFFNINSFNNNLEKYYNFNKIIPYFNYLKEIKILYFFKPIDAYNNIFILKNFYKTYFLNAWSEITDFYFSDPVSKVSSTMSICSKRFTLLNDFIYMFSNKY